jgi:hypothetical protein
MGKKLWGLAILLPVIFLLMSGIALAQVQPYGPTYTGSATVSQTEAGPGELITVSGSGFKPGSTVQVFWDGVKIASAVADENGFVSVQFRIPSDASPGVHTVSLVGERAQGGTLTLSKNITVVGVVSEGLLPFTGGQLMLALLVGGLVLAVAGFGLGILRPNRSKQKVED